MTAPAPNSVEYIYVLCAGKHAGQSLPWSGTLPPLPKGQTYIGFVNGMGDPEYAVLYGETWLHGDAWAVVRISADAVMEDIKGKDEVQRAIRFASGFVMFRGEPLQALAALQAYTDGRSAPALRLVPPNEFTFAEAEAYSVALACVGGIARAGDHGHAIGGMIAIAGKGGRATPGLENYGEPPLAIVEANGTAKVSGYGIAMGRGPQVDIVTGDFGKVFAPLAGAVIHAGRWSEVVARRPYNISAGANSLVVVHARPEDHFHLQIGEGSLLIVHGEDSSETASGVVARPGENGLAADEWCKYEDGAFATSRDLWNAERPTEDDYQNYMQFDETLADQMLARRRTRKNGTRELTSNEAAVHEYFGKHISDGGRFVLCMGLREDDGWPEHGMITRGTIVVSRNWDAKSPSLYNGFRGLLDGVGDPRAASFYCAWENYWYLVSVDEFLPVPPVDANGHPAAVRFERGTIVAWGGVAEMLDMLDMITWDADQRIGELSIGADAACKRVASFSAAIVGRRGLAIAGYASEAEAGDYGIAMVGGDGRAISGHRGVAIADEGGLAQALDLGMALSLLKRYGEARANDRGYAVAIGRYKIARAGHYGCATTSSWRAEAGDHATAIATDGTARVGEFGIAIGKTVSGGTNARLVALSNDGKYFASAIVGMDGVEPHAIYGFQDGQFVKQ